MKKQKSLSILFVFAALLVVMSLPKSSSEKVRGASAALLGPFWENLSLAKAAIASLPKPDKAVLESSPPMVKSIPEEVQRLSIENQLLRNEIVHLQELLNEKQSLEMSAYQAGGKAGQQPAAADRHHKDLLELLTLRQEAVPARVIYRTPSSWNSSFWINVGQKQNNALGRDVIAKNSPVVAGMSLVGVIDYVGQSQSRVRLITDSGLYPAVRAARGRPQDRMLAEAIKKLIENLNGRGDLFKDKEEKLQLLGSLLNLENLLRRERAAWYLAKGEVHGSSSPLWRTQGTILKGIGFNYDFEDDDGPARDLRTGKPQGKHVNGKAIPILRPKDILVTTGMDGVFPPGLQVAEVKSINVLKEGDYYYELEALPTAGDLDDISLVFVIPPSGYDPEDQPSLIGSLPPNADKN